MERRGRDNSLADRILTAPRRVVVVTGPAACGKTAAAMDLYRRYLDEAGRPRCLLLAPNAPAASYLRRRMLEASGSGVCVSPGVLTFAALAGRVLAAAGERARPISPFRRQLLLSRIVAELNEAGELSALGAVADTPGLVVTLDRAIAELKRAAVEPEDLARAVGSARDKRSDLVAVYRRYQQELHRAAGYDIEGQIWLAREHLRAAAGRDEPLPGLAGVEAIVADGFTDFTPTQLEILRLLSGRLERVVVTLPHAADGRARMWHWTDRTLQNVRHRFGQDLAEIALDPATAPDADAPPAPLRAVWDGAFRFDAGRSPPAEVSLLSAAGLDAEVAAAARHAKALLCAGVPVGRIAVLARSMEAYGEAVRRIFPEHDVPVADAPQPLTDVPIVRFLLDLAALAPELAWRDGLRVVKNSYFRPAALGDCDERTVAAAEVLIREGNVLAGREAFEAAAARLAARAERERAEADEDDGEPPPYRPGAGEIARAGEMLGRLFDLAERAADPTEWRGLIDALDLPAAARAHDRAEVVARDLRALAALGDCLADLPAPPPTAGQLREALSAVSCPAARGESLVDVLDVLDARALRYDHVLLLGVSERQFPVRHVEGSLVGEADREAWRHRGVVLDSRQDLTAREMLLFYLAISRADAALTLSYLESDASGRTGSPSSFLLDVVGGEKGLEAARVKRIPPGEMIAPASELASPRDATNAALAGLFGGADEPHRAAMGWVVAHRGEVLRRTARGLWARHRRWLAGECNEFDGRISDPALLEALRQRYPHQTVFSAGQLDAYGQCPWQHFAAYVLRLAPLAEPQRRLEPQTRGVFCHDVLFRLMRSLAERAGGPVRLADVNEANLAAVLDEAVGAEAGRVDARHPPYPALWRIQLAQMRRDLWEYLLRARSADGLDARSLHFELAFGRELDDAEGHDPASRADPVTVTTPAGDLRLRGRIDRVDRVRAGEVEGLLVVDYKTGRLPTDADMAAGRNLQMPLYAKAVEAMLGAPSVGGAFHRVGATRGSQERYFAAIKPARGGFQADDGYDDRLADALATVARFVGAMAAGRFDALPTHDCPSYCPFRRICHYAPARAEVKAPSPAADEEGA